MYRTEYRILSSDTDAKRQLKLSRLYTLLQEASIAHTTALGMGREKTLDKGLLWIITLQQTRIARMPAYDETVCIKSWPGRTMHLLFPRYYRIEDRKGNALIEASALWALMDKATRRAAFPEEYGVAIRGVHTGKEIPLPTAPKAPATEADSAFTVPYSYVDLNGHMNNTRFYDLAEDCLPEALRTRALVGVRTEYTREVRFGTTMEIRRELRGDTFLLAGESDGQRLFRLALDFAPEEGAE